LSLPTLTIEQVRLVHLATQGLLNPPVTSATKVDVLNAIRRMGALQIDTISVVARSPYFVLFSRLGEYDPKWLDELLVEKALFEHWAHAACFIPMEDFPFFRRLILEGHRTSYFGEWAEQNRTTLDHVLEVVRQEGAKRSADFESEKSPGGWWNWKIEKAALEYWLSRGELMVSRRDKFQRVYDLTTRVLPDWSDAEVPPHDEVNRKLILNTVHALGIARPLWIADYYRLKKKVVPPYVEELKIKGQLQEVAVEGWPEPALYCAMDASLIEDAVQGKLTASHTTVLSPFDPITWDRDRARQLFNFDFMIQCYTPAAKRQFGYFPLPILHRGALVGRLDAKAHRKDGVFEVKALFMENEVSLSDSLAQDLVNAIKRCAQWHKTPEVVIRKGFPEEFVPLLRNSLKNSNGH
jgi:uncharacterized protein